MKIYPLESIKVEDEKSNENHIKLPSIDEYGQHYSWDVRCMFCWESNKRLIILIICCIIITIVTVGILIFRSSSTSTTTTNPCSNYVPGDLASSVSLDCFRFLWQNNGCKTTVPDGYKGFWLQSPSGGKTVLCTPPNIGDQCGAGSYSYIINNVWVCNLNYKGY